MMIGIARRLCLGVFLLTSDSGRKLLGLVLMIIVGAPLAAPDLQNKILGGASSAPTGNNFKDRFFFGGDYFFRKVVS
jgi:hypothetical protein